MNLDKYLSTLTPKIFKILPMFEEGDQGLPLYLERFLAELHGGTFTFPSLAENTSYTSIINNLNYLLHCDYSRDECRRIVFDSISLAEKIRNRGEERG